MSQTEKAAYYKELKDAGVQFSKHYRDYSTEELATAVQKLRESQPISQTVEPPEDPHPSQEQLSFADVTDAALEEEFGGEEPPPPAAPVAPRNENEMPGQRLNTKAADEPIRIDEEGKIWYQEEVSKPAFPKPRGRRVLKYTETGTKTVTAKNGEYTETFEVAGDEMQRSAEVKITLPSYQVGIYKDPRFPFRIHTYAGNRGFDLFEVEDYYGGSDLVPPEVKRTYVENVLCYDIRTTVRDIQMQYRQLQLAGKVD